MLDGVVQGLNCYQCGQYNDGVGSITPCINYTATQLKECPKTSEYCIVKSADPTVLPVLSTAPNSLQNLVPVL
ncbi:hypothetical protein TKK_0000742 [Trichogramma kaykai]